MLIDSLEICIPKRIKPSKNKDLPIPKDHGLSLAVSKVARNEQQMIKVIKADVPVAKSKELTDILIPQQIMKVIIYENKL